jgi:creatinine amidohydrolase
MRSGRWEDLTTTDFATIDCERTIALLPVAAVEQHGPHLPLGTDRIIAEALAGQALNDAPADLAVLQLPTLAVGDSTEHTAFAGTLSINAEALIAIWAQIGADVARSGVRKLAIINSHGGQPQIVDIVAQRLRAEHRMLVARINSYALGVPDGLFTESEQTYGYHGGALETSLMLHLAPTLVRQDAIADFPSGAETIAARSARLGAEGEPGARVGIGWQIQDLNPDGACGDARDADAARGAGLFEHMATCVNDVLNDMGRFPLSDLRDSRSSVPR